MPFIPHTEQDIKEMLEIIGVSDIAQLFDEIPDSLLVKALPDIPESLTEMALTRLMKTRAACDGGLLCFIGAGAYEHHVPAAVWEVTSRGEFLTAYTPYQAEASQGTLQLLYEYQTMMASLMGLDVSNASLYEGATALAEAILMAVRSNRKSHSHTILVPETVHPHYRAVIKTIARQQEINIVEVPFDQATGIISAQALEKYQISDVTALVIPQPNFFGQLEKVDMLTDWAHAKGALAIGVVNPLAMSLLRPPGQWGEKGADIACGDGQALGIPLTSGGPYYGFLCCKKVFVRQMPGRIVGRTLDKEGKQGFVLTLQAREQHIRRSKATSNICTNQGLLVTASTIYMSLVGPVGLRQVAMASHHNLMLLEEYLHAIAGLKSAFSGLRFHETVVKLPVPVNDVLLELAKAKVQGGFAIQAYYPSLENALLICVTETKTAEDIQRFVQLLADVVASLKKNNNPDTHDLVHTA